MKKRLFISFLTILSGFSLLVESVEKLPIVYGHGYDINILGPIDRHLHETDGERYSKIYKYLMQVPDIAQKDIYLVTEKVSDETLLQAHTQKYLESLKNNSVLAKACELDVKIRLGLDEDLCSIHPLFFLRNNYLQRKLLDPMRLAVTGSIKAAKLALEHGWAINLGGGYHHAKSDEAIGGCIFNDIALAIHALWKEDPKLKVLIVDTDAHQGNGYAAIFKDHKQINILDIFNVDQEPTDVHASQWIDYPIMVRDGIKDIEYLNSFKSTFKKAIKEKQPGFIMYNAGLDPYEHDDCGGMLITEKALIERDAFVFEQAEKKNIPVSMMLSGSYSKDAARIHAQSIMNILKKKGIITTEDSFVFEQSVEKTMYEKVTEPKVLLGAAAGLVLAGISIEYYNNGVSRLCNTSWKTCKDGWNKLQKIIKKK